MLQNTTFNQTLLPLNLPGAKSQVLLEMQAHNESTAVTYPKNIPIAIKRATGVYVEDMDDNIYLDFLAGAGVLNMGHNHPHLIKAAMEQMQILCHSLDFPTPIKQEFKQALLNCLPKSMRANMRMHFCGPTGSDAVETAIKIARAHTQRNAVVSFQGSYHGSTHLAMGLTGYVGAKQHQPDSPQGVSFFPFPYCFRCPVGLNSESCEINCLTYLENTLKDTHGGITKPAAIIIEPVQGEGGSIPGNKSFFSRLQSLACEQDIPLIVDEVQTGIGRTGTWFAFEQFGIEPDIVISSKAISGIGQPIAVVMYNRKFIWPKGAHIGTFRGNQVAMASAVENLRLMREENILNNVNVLSKHAYARFNESLAVLSTVGDIRGMGFMMGIEIVNPVTKSPCTQRARDIQKIALRNGLITELGGRHDAVIRLLPPLNISLEILNKAIEILINAIEENYYSKCFSQGAIDV